MNEKKTVAGEFREVIIYTEDYDRDEKTATEVISDAKTSGDNEVDGIWYANWLFEKGQPVSQHPATSAHEVMGHTVESVEDIIGSAMNYHDFYLLVRPESFTTGKFSRLGPFGIQKGEESSIDELKEFIESMAMFDVRIEFTDPDFARYLYGRKDKEDDGDRPHVNPALMTTYADPCIRNNIPCESRESDGSDDTGKCSNCSVNEMNIVNLVDNYEAAEPEGSENPEVF